VHVLAFDPSQSNLLVIGLANDTLHIFDVELRQFPSWSQPLSQLPSKRSTHVQDPILGVTFDPQSFNSTVSSDSSNQALLWSSSWLRSVRLDGAVCTKINPSTKKRRRQNRRESTITSNEEPSNDALESNLSGHQREPKVITHYRPNLFAGFIGPRELVVVERPLVDVLAALPPAYFKHKYGAS
jgi:U3 small nucleolar RNA-associated protein 4